MAEERKPATRVDIGFSGGQVLSVRLQDSVYSALRKALEGRGDGGGWHELQTEDSELTVDLGEVVYIRLDTEKAKVGF